jgi:hypothetical protein
MAAIPGALILTAIMTTLTMIASAAVLAVPAIAVRHAVINVRSLAYKIALTRGQFKLAMITTMIAVLNGAVSNLARVAMTSVATAMKCAKTVRALSKLTVAPAKNAKAAMFGVMTVTASLIMFTNIATAMKSAKTAHALSKLTVAPVRNAKAAMFGAMTAMATLTMFTNIATAMKCAKTVHALLKWTVAPAKNAKAAMSGAMTATATLTMFTILATAM